MDSCRKCYKILHYEPSCDGMCMECWDIWGRFELPWEDDTESREFKFEEPFRSDERWQTIKKEE